MLQLNLDADTLRPLVQAVVDEVMQHRDHAERRLSADRLAYSEPEAAMLLGVQRHVLRDARRRGELVGSRLGRGVVYRRDELLRFLSATAER